MAESVQVQHARRQALAGIPLTRNEILGLLAIPLGSEEDQQLRNAAKEVAMAWAGGKAYVWAAVGLDYAPCPMNCQFCSFGQDWGVVQEPSQLRREDALAQIRAFVEGGARFVVLRTTEFYSIPELLELVREIRRTIPGPYEVILNAGEFGPDIARQMVEAGVSGIYHACRLREGTDTPFDPALRLATMQSVTDSPLKLISLVEPMGPEHTHEEIADNFLNIVRHGAVISGAMARIPVPGTPLGALPRLDDSRLAQRIAVLRLSGGSVVKDICVHPASPEALASGANVVVVETGAVPRDTTPSGSHWNDFDLTKARQLLESAGYEVSNHE
jgi:biotin synthase